MNMFKCEKHTAQHLPSLDMVYGLSLRYDKITTISFPYLHVFFHIVNLHELLYFNIIILLKKKY